MSNGSMPLSDREQEILRLVATGVTNQQIARRLVISINTVKVHMRNIFSKIGVESRTEASMWAVHNGLVEVKTQQDDEVVPEPDAEILSTAPEVVLDATAAAKVRETPAVPLEPISRARRIFLVASAAIVLALAIAPTVLRSAAPIRVEPGSALADSVSAVGSNSTTPSSRWAARAQMPSARTRLAVVALDQVVYAIGGDASGRPSDAVEVYNPAHNLWQIRAPKPTAVSNIGAAVIAGHIYVPGGMTVDNQPSAVLEVYDPVADTWTSLKPLPKPLCAYALATLNGRLYMFGGWDGSKYVRNVYSYDPARDEWKATTPLAEPRGFAAAGVLGGKIYVVGGFDGQQEFASCDEYDPSHEGGSDSPWRQRSPMAVGRGGLAVTTVAEMLFAVGGGWQSDLTYNERYDPRTNAWFSFESPITGQWRNLGLAAVGVRVYAIGGWSGDSLSTNEEYQALYRITLPIPPRP
jgi:DNA-binding CsgD family transcriptional regulator